MSEYLFNSRETFLARCWWQASAQRIEPQAWADQKHRLSAMWVETGSRGNRGHWDHYLQSEENGVLEKRLDPVDYLSPSQRYFELFWFGAYTKGSAGPGKRLYYEIRPADRKWNIARWALDSNAWSGYVGIWETDEAQGALRKPASARLWTIDGLAPEMQEGERRFNVLLSTPNGGNLRRYASEGALFFNTNKGDAGRVAMEILSIPHQHGEV